jgi:hypothetical protein
LRNALFVHLILSTALSGDLYADSCESWFKEAKLKAGPGCIAICSTLAVGMDTFSCPGRCKALCDDRSFIEKTLGDLAYYPGLNVKERELIAQHPKEAIQAFFQKEKAESASYKRFGRDTSDDESDAFRHFVWAGLLSKELGPDLAKEFLDAHEFGQTGEPGSAMDLANNRAGLLTAEKLRREGKLNQDEVEKEAIKALKEKTLVVLKPKGGPK